MRFYLMIIILAISAFVAYGQQETLRDVPALFTQLAEARSDTARILLQCKLGEAFRSNKPDTTFLLATDALKKSIELKFVPGEIHAYLLLCVLQREKGDLPNALDLGLRALKLAQGEPMPLEQSMANARVAVVYLAVGDFNKAISYLKTAEAILQKNHNEFQWFAVQYFLGSAYEQLNNLDAAEQQLEKLEKKLPLFPEWLMITKRLQAYIAVKRNRLPLAIEYYRESYAAAMEATALREAATTANAMAMAFKKLGETDSAIYYAKQGLSLGEKLSYQNRILVAGTLLAGLYSEKDPKESVKYYKIASVANDSLYSMKKILQLQAATMKEQERQTEMEASRLAYRNRVRQYAFLVGAGVFLVIASILYRNNRQKQKSNRVLEATLTNLKATQAQLIQSEKMASLGELTAGIAHEIQNPLNFVNNFSEVNNELIEELKSENTIPIAIGTKFEERAAILDDVYQNNEKIKFHGKRAEAIVKGMLQHSQVSAGQKESTDINELADEYFRLSYHGMRAKDNTFNAHLETHFDPSIGKITIIPQDIGRVLLNLYNNAFYAVNEKKALAPESYEPSVSVNTEKSNGKIKIRVKDNGNGIPQKLLDKIFQPFFTTKPTGQGTGLGLSLAYDIIKAHGGEIKVQTKDSEATEFIIQLPLV